VKMAVKAAVCLVAAVCAAARGEPAPQAFTAQASAESILAVCRSMLPDRPVTLRGAIIMRNRKGIPKGEYGYTLMADRTKTPAAVDVVFTPRDATNVIERAQVRRPGPVPEGRILNTDVTWLDLTLDFLWWTKAEFEADREGETVHGQKCTVILARPEKPEGGVSAVRLWVDRKTGCLMQAEQLDASMKPIRRLWGTRVKKFGDRWMANVLEVETLGSGHRTKITVEEIDFNQN